jgi:hypothetical protein
VSVAGAADSAGWLDVRVRSVGVFFDVTGLSVDGCPFLGVLA